MFLWRKNTMLTKQKVAPRREIFNCANEVYITFYANQEKKEEFALILKSEEEACRFAACFEKLLKEVDMKGHCNTSTRVEIFTNQPKCCGSIQMKGKKFDFTCKEGTDARVFHEAFSYEVWGDTAN